MLTAQNGALFATICARAQHFHFGPLPCASCLRPFRLGNAGQKVNRRRPSKQLKHADDSSLPPVPAVCDNNRYREHRNSHHLVESVTLPPASWLTNNPQRAISRAINYSNQFWAVSVRRPGDRGFLRGNSCRSRRGRINTTRLSTFTGKFDIPRAQHPKHPPPLRSSNSSRWIVRKLFAQENQGRALAKEMVRDQWLLLNVL